MAIRPCYLPDEYYIRIGSNPRVVYFDDVEIPYFQGYRAHRWIKYNHRSRHFRTVKKLGNKYLTLDGYTIKWIEEIN